MMGARSERIYVASLNDDITFLPLGQATTKRFPAIEEPIEKPAHPPPVLLTGATIWATKSVVGLFGSAIPILHPVVSVNPLNAMPVLLSVYGETVWAAGRVA